MNLDAVMIKVKLFSSFIF